MTFPEKERVIYESNPLRQVLCQVRFPAILQIGSEIPAAFQNRVRRTYPIYHENKETGQFPEEIASILERFSPVKRAEGIHHTFGTHSGERTITLHPDFVAFEDKQYEQWETFSEQFKLARESLEEIYSPDSYTRIGLRYKDVIDRAELGLGNEPWGKLLNRSLTGIVGDDEIGQKVQKDISITTIALDEVAGAIVTLRHGLTIIEEEEEQSQVYVIDSDFFIAERREKDDVAEILAHFNRAARNLFRWAITDRLHQALGPTGL